VKLTAAIPSYGREDVLLQTIEALLALDGEAWELLVMDQTPAHQPEVEVALASWQASGRIRWIRQFPASVTAAMNRALQEARGDQVLFLDDDIIPDLQLLRAHQAAAARHPEALIAGRVLQPWHQGLPDPGEAPFLFNSLEPRLADEFIGCNFSLPRAAALVLGGFDQHFVRVAYRFEAEFAHRWRQTGRVIHYEPAALIHHLKAERGGTRSYGEHLTTVRPDHAVGRYYFLLRTKPLPAALAASAGQLIGSVRSRHHLRRPWWIPLTWIAELRGLLWALRLHHRGPRLLPRQQPRLLIATSHPIQYQAPLFRALAADPALDQEVLFLTMPNPDQQGAGFGVPFSWDLPLLEGYRWRQAGSSIGAGLGTGFRGLRLRRPARELRGADGRLPDAVLITGWQVQGLLQLYWAAWRLRLPILLRVEAPDRPLRRWPVRCLHRFLVGQAAACLPIGHANARFFQGNGALPNRLFASPYFVDNAFFAELAGKLQPRRNEIRARWGIPADAFCFLFAGKLQAKKHPLDLLEALRVALTSRPSPPLHLLFVGTGELEADCRRLVSEHQLPVSFAGFLNQGEIAAAYVAADALVLPSSYGETWGLVVNEAMACGLPAIVSDQVGCAEDLVSPGATGIVFPCRHVAALAQALLAMAADPAAAARMGIAARERVFGAFGVDQAAAGLRQAVQAAITTER
jgi:GT2 family glycosyltransferase